MRVVSGAGTLHNPGRTRRQIRLTLWIERVTQRSGERQSAALLSHNLRNMQQQLPKANTSSNQIRNEGLVLSRSQVATLERMAEEIWIYAALGYSMESISAHSIEIVRTNLQRGARYRYLVGDRPQYAADVNLLRKYYQDAASDPTQLQFRVVKWNWMLPDVGIAIYDPDIAKRTQKHKDTRKTTIVLSNENRSFPESKGFKNWGFEGPATRPLQELFLDVWENSRKYENSRVAKLREQAQKETDN